MKTKPAIKEFSINLFWDANPDELDMDSHKAYIIQRVLERGTMSDWRLIKAYYGLKTIGEEAVKFRTLDPKARTFITALTGIPKEKFRCYTYQQSMPKHWVYEEVQKLS
jgi:hypothetical protein